MCRLDSKECLIAFSYGDKIPVKNLEFSIGGNAASIFPKDGDPIFNTASLFLAGVAFGFNSPVLYTIGQTLGGPRGGGKWIAFQNCLGNVAGIVAPIITGAVVDRTGAFTWAFAVAGLVSVAGAASWAVMIRKVAPLAWPPALPTQAALG